MPVESDVPRVFRLDFASFILPLYAVAVFFVGFDKKKHFKLARQIQFMTMGSSDYLIARDIRISDDNDFDHDTKKNY